MRRSLAALAALAALALGAVAVPALAREPAPVPIAPSAPLAALEDAGGRTDLPAALDALGVAPSQQAALAAAVAAPPAAPPAGGSAGAAAAEPRVFRFPVVLFATWFDVAAGQTGPRFQEGNDAEHFARILDGFGGNPTGTLTEFYFENSYGQFLVEVDILTRPDGSPYVSTRSSLPGEEGACYYGDIEPSTDLFDDLDLLDSLPLLGAGGLGVLGMAIELFTTTTIGLDHDFSRYDNDGDGDVDFLGILHSGPDMAVTQDPCHTWSHAFIISTFASIVPTLLAELGLPLPDLDLSLGLPIPGDTVTYDRVFTMPEFDQPGGRLNIGVAVHEMAHALGEPDYYGTDGSTSGDGDWDVMAGGSYGGTPSGSNPTWFNPASRVFQGWVTPTIVHEDTTEVTLRRRSSQPADPAAPNPNLLLVPTKWIRVGETDELGHTWTRRDVHGLVADGERGYVIEGFYLEYAGRLPARAPAIHPSMTRESYFDRWLYGSGLLVWHFDYWRRSNVLHGSNGGNDDPLRMQMDVEEWDRNDDTQEIALNLNRADPTDVAWDAATGITSGTHVPGPETDVLTGTPQADVSLRGGPLTGDAVFTVDDNPANRTMTVTMTPNDLLGLGDCTLQLLTGPPGQEVPATGVVDSGSFGAPESVTVTTPQPGRWVARVSDFLLCTGASGTASFVPPTGLDPRGSGDTWSNWTGAPTGWAFTNIRTGGAEGLSHGLDAGAGDAIVLDVLHVGDDERDLSPGFARPAENGIEGRQPVVAGRANAFAVPVFANGGVGDEAVEVVVRRDRRDGPVVASGSVTTTGYGRTVFPFAFDPGREGGWDLYVEVDPGGALPEASEANNVQHSSGWAGPADPVVLVVDDDGAFDNERIVAGTLAALGVPYAVAERHATAEEMAGYEAVVWVGTLDRYDGQLDERDRREIAEYLGSGGALWLTSNRAMEALATVGQAWWGARWFGVESASVNSYFQPVTFAPSDILAPVGPAIVEVIPGRPVTDRYLRSGGALGTVTAIGTLADSGTRDDGAVLGARLDGVADGTPFRSAVTAFSPSQLRNPDQAIALTEAMLSWLGVGTGRYEVTSPEPVVYHSQVRSTVPGADLPVRAIVLGGAPGRPVTLHHRAHTVGGAPDRRLTMEPVGGRGGHLAVIPADQVTPDGLVYALQAGAGSTWDPRAAADGGLAHGVAVFLPEVAAPEAPPSPPSPPSPAPPGPPPAREPAGGPTLPATGSGAASGLVLAAVAGALALAARRRDREAVSRR